MRFHPPCCPHASCASRPAGAAHAGAPGAGEKRQPFLYRRRGSFLRKCDGRRVPRFQCLTCGRSFSSQTFRFDYRLKLPDLHLEQIRSLVSKVTLRQQARIIGVSRGTIAHRARRLGAHSRALHAEILEPFRGRLSGTFQLDELETFEQDRRLGPVTVPELIHRRSFFVIHAEVAALPARGRLNPGDQKRKEAREAEFGRRTCGSREAVTRCIARLEALCNSRLPVEIQTDLKRTYGGIIARTLPAARHVTSHSKVRRDRKNLLFPVNHTFAQQRDAISRLVRRNWGASKKRECLNDHLFIRIAYRNYVRGITVKTPHVTPAMALGIASRPFSFADWTRFRPQFARRLHAISAPAM